MGGANFNIRRLQLRRVGAAFGARVERSVVQSTELGEEPLTMNQQRLVQAAVLALTLLIVAVQAVTS